MAKATGISVSSVQRIWHSHGLAPHRVRQFKLSNDPKFADRLRDVVGLYVDPSAHTVVLSVDEKSQIQALEKAKVDKEAHGRRTASSKARARVIARRRIPSLSAR